MPPWVTPMIDNPKPNHNRLAGWTDKGNRKERQHN